MRKIFLILFCAITFPIYADIVDFQMLTGNAAFSPRVFPASCVFNGKLWVIGGANKIYIPTVYYNDVWYTVNGIDWEAATRNAAWPARFRTTVFVFNNRMYLAAGNNGGYLKDVWVSDNGVDWEPVTLNAAFKPKSNQCQNNMVFQNKMWLIAGQNEITDPNPGPCKEVWYSSNGADWYAATLNAEFDGRAGFAGTVFNGAMYIGGGAGQAGGYCNNIWRSYDGASWTKLAEPIYLNFGASFQHEGMVVYNNKMWILGGSRPDTGEAFDIALMSSDGLTWTNDADIGQVRNAGFTEVYNGFIVTGAGQANDIGTDPQPVLNDVWFSYPGTETITPTYTLTRTTTPSYTPTLTRTGTKTYTITPTFTATPTNTTIETKTFTQTITPTWTNSPTGTPTLTITLTWTVSQTLTVSPTFTVTPSFTPIETVVLWLAQTAGYGAPNDTSVAWRQYPDTSENPVLYTLYLTNISDATEPNRIIVVPNIDDQEPAWNVFGFVVQGLTGGDCYSATLTAVGGDFGVSFMSNNIEICPKIRTEIDVINLPTPAVNPDFFLRTQTVRGGGEDGELTTIGMFHAEQHKCEAFYWSMSRTVGTGTDYFGFNVPQGKTMHARLDLTALDGVIQARIFNVPFGGAGVTFTAHNFCSNIAGAPTPMIAGYEKVNTLTACSEANAVSARRTAGSQTSGTPAGGKVGNSSAEGDADWAILGAGTYVLRLIGLVSGDAYDMTLYDYKHGAK